jgi:hypothetical protein
MGMWDRYDARDEQRHPAKRRIATSVVCQRVRSNAGAIRWPATARQSWSPPLLVASIIVVQVVFTGRNNKRQEFGRYSDSDQGDRRLC